MTEPALTIPEQPLAPAAGEGEAIEAQLARARALLADLSGLPATATLDDLAGAARVREQRYQLVVEQSEQGVIVTDSGWHIEFVNAQLSRLLGYTAAEMAGRVVTDFMDPAWTPTPAEVDDRRRGAPGNYESKFLGKGGQHFWVRVISSPLVGPDDQFRGVLMLILDITEQQETLRFLRESEESFRQMIERSPDMVFVHRRLQLMYMNPTAIRLLGYQPDEAPIGQSVLNLIGAHEHVAALALIAQVEERGQTDAVKAFHLLTRDGKALLTEFHALTVIFQGTPAVLSMGRDVTERRKLETRLMISDRMASIGTLAAGVAHEINNPLAYVVSNLDFVSREISGLVAGEDRDLSEVRNALREAQEGADRVRLIVRDLKSFSRSDEVKRGLVDLHRVITGAANMTQNEVRHRAHLVKDFAAETPLVLGNEGRLGQVILNLIVNAAHAIADGAAERNEIRITTRTVGDQISVEVKDSGSGIPPEIMGKLFDPFFTTKPVGVGTGLGLSICHNIVVEHGGRIEVESVLGRGSTFRILLPRAREQRPAAITEPPPQPPQRRAHVLVIDDEPMIGQAIRRSLAGAHDVTLLTRAQEALALLTGDQRFDFILCDLMMPEMTGMDFYDQLMARDPKQAQAIIFLTGGTFTERARTFLESVPNLRLEKPFDIKNLLRIVNGH